MKYQNRRTGALIDVECELTGGEWEAVTPPASADGKKSKKKDKTSDGQDRTDGELRDDG